MNPGLTRVLLVVTMLTATIGFCDETPFLRVVPETGRPLAVETAVETWTGERDGEVISVDLIAAIHIADAAYYQELQQLFESYDSLLYELVASPDQRPGDGQSSVYAGFAEFLELSDQMAEVDYSAANFVHADLSPEELAAAMDERSETVASLFSELMRAAQQGMDDETSNADFLRALLLSGSRAMAMKRVMAPQLRQADAVFEVLEASGGTSLIADRNARALEVLDAQIEAGQRDLGIFYGAGHLAAMRSELLGRDLEMADRKWLVAWDLE